MIKKCIICGKEYLNRDKRSKHCDDIECRKLYYRSIYKNKKYKKICIECNKELLLTQKQKLCQKCRNKLKRTNNFKIKIIKEFRCKYCNKLIYIDEVYNTRGDFSVNKNKVCDSCKIFNRKRMSNNMKGDKNPNWQGGPKPKKYKNKYEAYKSFSDRMKKNNPMFNPSVVEKVRKTILKKYKNGEIERKLGKNNPLWKGNRENSLSIRSRLKQWKKDVLKRDDFTCRNCGIRGGYLEVHHLKKFCIIVNQSIKELKIKQNLSNINNNSDDFEKLCNLIVKKHNDNLDY